MFHVEQFDISQTNIFRIVIIIVIAFFKRKVIARNIATQQTSKYTSRISKIDYGRLNRIASAALASAFRFAESLQSLRGVFEAGLRSPALHPQ